MLYHSQYNYSLVDLTFPLKLEDNPSYPQFPGGPATVEYRESIYVGYRYFDTVGQDVLFPFGHGLSYTSFEYSDLSLSQDRITDTGTLTVSLKVTNTGPVKGKETVQLYVRDLESTPFRPDKELKGFAKVELEPGEGAEVRIELGPRAFAFYDAGHQDWRIESGTFEILAGASSRDIRLKAAVEVKANQQVSPADREKLATYYDVPKGARVSQADFEVLLDRPVPPNRADQKGEYTLNTPLGDMSDSFIGRRLHGLVNRQMAGMMEGLEGTPTGLLMEAMTVEMPLRLMLMMGGGAMNRGMLEALLDMLNGRTIGGLFSMVKAMRQKGE